ncbi:MAG: phosphatidylglycerophosphatase A [Legionellaceae bacterium]|nr:phosphatidylglycerophosphatase A [Legionellaceae bacterium]
MVQLSFKKVWQDPIYFLAFGFGSGLAPFAPGTFGTVAALPLYFLLALLPPQIYLVMTLLAFVLGVWVCGKVSRDLGVHDHAGIVWDEIVGFLLTMFLVPVHLIWVVTGFMLFRIFDIWKPYPIRWVDKQVTGGLGIMVDDVLAAIPACFILQVISHLFPVGAG